ncbi:MAG: hypothetical protein ABIQ02_00125, partial [Saprospiraceae bacterium]
MKTAFQGILKTLLIGQLFILFSTPGMLISQPSLCTGNLGENIFASGDFGSGSANLIPNDPGLSPGFTYTLQVPPDDGQYTITNDMATWSFVFPGWIKIGDNSSDPNGYMMVVNASYAPGIFYEQTIDAICEKTLYQFSADVINLIAKAATGRILPNISFLIDDVVIYSSGEIAQDEKWHSYGFSFTTGPAQNSVKLTLRNNAPGGFGNDLALDNIGFRACGPSSSISISPVGKVCENSLFPVLAAQIDADTGSIQWQVSIDAGLIWSDIIGAVNKTYQVQQQSSGAYHFRFLYSTTISNLANPKCRIISDTIRVEVVPVEFMIKKTLCEGLTFNLDGVEYGQTGIYEDHLTASNGCDSIVTLDLVIVPNPPIVADFTFTTPSCEGAKDGSISVLSVSGTRPPFIFRINDSIIPPPETSVTLSAGTYTAWILDDNGCFDKQEITVPDGPRFKIHTTEDTTIVLGHSILLETTYNLPVSMSVWDPPDGVECFNCLSTLATPFEDITYVITAETEAGCVDMDSVRIRIDRDPFIYMPNVFSP